MGDGVGSSTHLPIYFKKKKINNVFYQYDKHRRK